MIKKFFAILIVIFFISFSFIFLSSLFTEKETPERSILYLEKGKGIAVVDDKENIIFEYQIEEFKNWAKENWEDVFDFPPSFGEERKVDPENFYRFDSVASLSPDFRYLAFSVSDYAMATTISFIGIINVEKEEIKMIGEKNMGGVQSMLWSPEGNYIAYILDTARAPGDYLSIDNVKEIKKEITLSGEDILGTLMEEDVQGAHNDFLPRFHNLSWEKDKALSFTTASDKEEREVFWSFDIEEMTLKKKRLEEKNIAIIEEGEDILRGVLVINNPGFEKEKWHLLYEEQGAPGLSIKLDIDEGACIGEDSFCEKIYNKKKDVSGEKVVIRGTKKIESFQVKEIQLEK